MPREAVPTVAQLEARIDEALVIARTSEEGVREVGEMALDAARQARRAAEAAEASAKAAAVSAQGPRPAGPVRGAAEQGPVAAPAEERVDSPRAPRFDARFRSFTERADRVSARLQRLGAHPSHRGGASVAAARRRGDG